MGRLEQRVERLEAVEPPNEQITVIIRRMIRPGDMACVGVLRREIGGGPPVWEEPMRASEKHIERCGVHAPSGGGLDGELG